MADPLSIAASVAGLITLADVIATRIFKFVKCVQGAEKEVSALLFEINSLYGVLHSVKAIASRVENEGLLAATSQSGLQSCFDTLQKIVVMLDKCNPERLEGFKGSMTNLKRKLRWPIAKSDTTELLREVARHKATFNLALNVDSTAALLNALAKQDLVIDQLSELQADTKKKQIEEAERSLNQEHRSILRQFERVDPRERYEIALKLRHQGTGTWFLKSEKFENFLTSASGKLWLYGIPGAGKTILSSTIIERMETMQGTASAFFYCDYKDEATHSLRNMLGSLAKQLSLQCNEALNDLVAFHKRHTNRANEAFHIRDESLVELLSTMAVRFNCCIIVVDGLDEISNDRQFITGVLAALSTQAPNVKTLFTSRKETDIEQELMDYDTVSVAAMSSDLRLYVAAELEKRISSNRLRIKDPSMRDLILERLVDKAEGMFQWVKCQLDYLSELYSDKDRREALESLPPTLPQTYERILERINRGSPKIRTLVQRTLKWIALCPEALDSLALSEVISVDLGQRNLQNFTDLPDKQDIRRCCSSLIREGPNDTLQLSHFSVREFLSAIDPALRPDLAPYSITINGVSDYSSLAQTCLTYLLFEDFNKTISRDENVYKKSLQRYSFLPHATQYWDLYFTSSSTDKEVQSLALRLFRPAKSQNFVHWMYRRIKHRDPYISHLNLLQILQGMVPLHQACSLGLPEIVKSLLDMGVDVNKQSTSFRSPLHCALLGENVLRREEDISRYTEEANDVNWRQSSRSIVVQTLIDEGAAQNSGSIKDLWNDTLYVSAVHVADVTFVTLLLKCGFKFSRTSFASTARYVKDFMLRKNIPVFLGAIAERNLEGDCIPLFLKLAAEFNIESELEHSNNHHVSSLVQHEYCATLVDAASNGQTEILLSCLSKIPRVTPTNAEAFSKAVLAASENGHSSAVEHLLDFGVDPVCRDETGNTPLHLAIEGLHDELVNLLLNREDHHDQILLARTNNGLSPVLSAIRTGSLKLLATVMDRGSNSSIYDRTKDGYTALHLAVESLSLPTFQYVQECGFPIDVQAENGTTAFEMCLIHVPSTELSLWLEMFLVTFRSDLKPYRKDGNGFVHLMAQRGSDFGVVAYTYLTKINTPLELFKGECLRQNCFGETPLHFAIHQYTRSFPYESADFVEILCEDTSELNIKDHSGKTPMLLLASGLLLPCQDGRVLNFPYLVGEENSVPEIFGWFLAKGADVNVVDNSGMQCLDYVSKWNSGALAQSVRNVLTRNENFDSIGITKQKSDAIVSNCGETLQIEDTRASLEGLHDAVVNGDVQHCERLLELGCLADGKSKDECGCSELMFALDFRDSRIAELLINHDASLDSRGCRNFPFWRMQPIHVAATQRMPEIVGLLLEKGANLKVFARGGTALQHVLSSVRYRHRSSFVYPDLGYLSSEEDATDDEFSDDDQLHDIVPHYVQPPRIPVLASFDEATTDRKFEIEFEEWCSRSRIVSDSTSEVVSLLLNSDHSRALMETVQDHVKGFPLYDYPLKIAVKNGVDYAVHALLDLGADCNVSDKKFRETPLMVAIEWKRPFLAHLLVLHGANIEARNIEGCTAMHVAARFHDVEALRYLKRQGGNIHKKDFMNRTVLHHILCHPHQHSRTEAINALEFCLAAGVDANAFDCSFQTPLLLSSPRYDQTLFSFGANALLDVPVIGPPITYLCGVRNAGQLKSIIKGLDGDKVKRALNTKTTCYGTALYHAAQLGNFDNVQLLIDHGAEINVIAGDLGTPLQASLEMRHFDIAGLLMQKGAKAVVMGKGDQAQPVWLWELSSSSFLATGDGAWNIRI